MKVDVKQLNSLALAYMGDVVHEIHVRQHLISGGMVKPNNLHTSAISFVSAKSQAFILQTWQNDDILTDEEAAVVRRGRNAKSNSTPKNTNVATYRNATAFEALLGYHYLLENRERLEELVCKAIDIIEKEAEEIE